MLMLFALGRVHCTVYLMLCCCVGASSTVVVVIVIVVVAVVVAVELRGQPHQRLSCSPCLACRLLLDWGRDACVANQ